MTKNYRDLAMELAEDGVITYQDLATMCLKYMCWDDIQDMLVSNEIIPPTVDDEDYDGQSDWEQEWEDFGETYGDTEYI